MGRKSRTEKGLLFGSELEFDGAQQFCGTNVKHVSTNESAVKVAVIRIDHLCDDHGVSGRVLTTNLLIAALVPGCREKFCAA